MILTRLGNKQKIADKIIKYFPGHTIYIEPFFGAGGMFFNKSKVQYNIINDLSSDVFNLFMVIRDRKEELLEALDMMPMHSDLLLYWKKNKETDPIQKAIRFLFLSNFTYLGKGETLKLGVGNAKNNVIKNIDKTYDLLKDIPISNFDFRKFIKGISLRDKDINKVFIYCDPPYLDTEDYEHKWTETDSLDLFDCLEETGCKWAMSEFDHPFILEQAKSRNLNVHIIGERQNLKNRRTEILVTNYEKSQLELF